MNETLILSMRIVELSEEWCHLQNRMHQMSAMLLSSLSVSADDLIMMIRNKYGFSKEEAKKIFYKYRSKSEEPEPPEDPKQKKTIEDIGNKSTDEKISMIMDYMNETSQKLEKIEDDIQLLKNQMEQILKKI